MPTLREVQTHFSVAILGQPANELGEMFIANGIDAGARLSIYRGTYLSALDTALRLTYPAVQRVVGEEFLTGAGRHFVEANPPTAADLNCYGEGFADFLDSFAPASSLPYLPDLARLEWAVSRALHADDSEALDPVALAAIETEDHPRIVFVPQPALTFLKVSFPVDSIWQAVLTEDDNALDEIAFGEGPFFLCVERLASGIAVTRQDRVAWEFAKALVAGTTLGEAASTLAPETLTALMAEHFARGRFHDFRIEQSSTSGDEQ